MADPVVALVLENLGQQQLQVGKVHIISEALSVVEKVWEGVEKLNAFIGNPSIQKEEEEYRVLATEVREVVYAGQDISDSFLILELQPQLKPTHLKRRLSLAKHLTSFTKTKLTPMLHRVDQILRFHTLNTHHQYGLKNQVESLPAINPDMIVGFKDEAMKLIKNVMEEREGLDVISITGMPGIGKTTLAWKIFHDQKIQREFRTRIWISLPQGLKRNDFNLHILDELAKQEQHYGLPDDNDRQSSVVGPFEFLQNIKFLLVVENVWTVDDWNAIKDVLPLGNKSGKVLITSQNESVCMFASWDDSSRRKPLKLGLLSGYESWEILQLQVFGNFYGCPHWLYNTGSKMAENCNGLPLAIEIIARNLVVATSTDKAIQLTKSWWKKVCNNVNMYITEYYKQQGASGSNLELSYNALLHQESRECFLYLGVFPQDYEIPTRTLTRLWAAEGFIRNTPTKSLEEIAKEVLEDLIHRNLVMVGRLHSNGKVKTCRVQEIKMSEKGHFDPPLSLTPNHRRLCIHSKLPQYLSKKPNGLGVRSLLCFQKGSDNDVLQTKHTSTIHKSFKFLKVFESTSIKLDEFPINLTRLMNLTYISLCCDHLAVLPETISHLLNLQTLVVATRLPKLEIKGNIWRMIRLRHLITKAAITLTKQGEAGKGGGELQTLTRLSPKYCNENMLSKTCNLKELGIRGKLATLLATDSLAKLDQLESLKLETDDPNLLHFHPSCFPSTLTSLTISAAYLDKESMLILGKMVNLKVLKLTNNAGGGDTWIAEGFPHLDFLFIGSNQLVSWEVSPHCFPCLRCLVLSNCGKLDKIPLSLAKSLEKLRLIYPSNSILDSAKKIKEESVRMQAQKGGLCELELLIQPERWWYD